MWGKNWPAARLSAVALGIAFGVASAIWMAAFAWTGGWGHETSVLLKDLSNIYPGFDGSWKGGFIGAAWGFVEGFIFGVVIAWIYNLCICCCKGCCRRGPEDEPRL